MKYLLLALAAVAASYGLLYFGVRRIGRGIVED